MVILTGRLFHTRLCLPLGHDRDPRVRDEEDHPRAFHDIH